MTKKSELSTSEYLKKHLKFLSAITWIIFITSTIALYFAFSKNLNDSSQTPLYKALFKKRQP